MDAQRPDSSADARGAMDTSATPDGSIDAGGDASTIDAGSETDAATGLPLGWVRPRCGDTLVDTCAECEGRPFVCDGCEASARCVAACDGDCADAAVGCTENGTCVARAEACQPWLFCACPPPSKECDRGAGMAPECVDDCAADCPGDPLNCRGRCGNDVDDLGCCPDLPGAEHRCGGSLDNDPARCHTSCGGCGEGFCARRGQSPEAPFVTCSENGCCADGVLCPSTGACVASCADCGPAWAGVCATRGQCVMDCAACSRAADPGTELAACDGFCTDVLSYQYHCGTCGVACSFPDQTCSLGHCCGADPESGLATEWCEGCGCCTDSYWCGRGDCTHCAT